MLQSFSESRYPVAACRKEDGFHELDLPFSNAIEEAQIDCRLTAAQATVLFAENASWHTRDRACGDDGAKDCSTDFRDLRVTELIPGTPYMLNRRGGWGRAEERCRT